jgi:hypothetical protein
LKGKKTLVKVKKWGGREWEGSRVEMRDESEDRTPLSRLVFGRGSAAVGDGQRANEEHLGRVEKEGKRIEKRRGKGWGYELKVRAD